MLVGLTKSSQIRDDHIRMWYEQGRECVVVSPVAWPTVQEDHRLPGTLPIIGEAESLRRRGIAHCEFLRGDHRGGRTALQGNSPAQVASVRKPRYQECATFRDRQSGRRRRS